MSVIIRVKGIKFAFSPFVVSDMEPEERFGGGQNCSISDRYKFCGFSILNENIFSFNNN